MREYERIGNRILAKNGANLSAVLYGLSNGIEEEKQSLSRLLNWIQRLPDEPYERFEFVVVKQLNDVIFGFKIHKTGELMSASEGFGLADAAVIAEAKRLKNKNNRVHYGH